MTKREKSIREHALKYDKYGKDMKPIKDKRAEEKEWLDENTGYETFDLGDVTVRYYDKLNGYDLDGFKAEMQTSHPDILDILEKYKKAPSKVIKVKVKTA